jgi:hypothetical protein
LGSDLVGADEDVFDDDAHAPEQFVAGAWSVDVGRDQEPDRYAKILGLLRPALAGIASQQLLEGDDPTRRGVALSASHTFDVSPLRGKDRSPWERERRGSTFRALVPPVSPVGGASGR